MMKVTLHIALVAAVVASSVTPIQKVVELLGEMKVKAAKEKHEEQVQWVAYKSFCDSTTAEKQGAIEKADSRIEVLNANIMQADSEVERLGGEIRGHEADATGWDADQKAADKARATERDTYMGTHMDYTESISALGHAISVLKVQSHDRAGVATLLQSNKLPPKATLLIQAFLAQTPEKAELALIAQDPSNDVPVTAYKARSTDIISMLEELEVKFKDELAELEKEEVSRRHAYQMLTQDNKQSVENANGQMTEKRKNVITQQQASHEGNAELKDVTATRADDAQYHADLTATCEHKENEYNERQQSRTEEISALEKAMELLSSPEVAGNAEKHLPKFAQLGKPAGTSLVFLRSSVESPSQLRAVAYLRDMGVRLNSRTLSTLAVQAGNDPFQKVKQLIQELIERLLSQATGEADHKGWCDSELATNAHTRKTKTTEIETLKAEIDGLDANVAQLGKDIVQLTEAISALDAAVGEATDLRNNESTENAATIKDAQDGQATLKMAMDVIKLYYSKNEKAAPSALVQRQTRGTAHQEPPPVFDGAYEGQQGAAGGVVGMLEVIEADFARLESDTKTAETTAQQAYDKFMEDSQVDKVQKETDKGHKANDQRAKETLMSEKKSTLETSEQELSTAEASFDKLRPACLEAGQSHEERAARRQEEIEALKEALNILSGDDILSLQQLS